MHAPGSSTRVANCARPRWIDGYSGREAPRPRASTPAAGGSPRQSLLHEHPAIKPTVLRLLPRAPAAHEQPNQFVHLVGLEVALLTRAMLAPGRLVRLYIKTWGERFGECSARRSGPKRFRFFAPRPSQLRRRRSSLADFAPSPAPTRKSNFSKIRLSFFAHFPLWRPALERWRDGVAGEKLDQGVRSTFKKNPTPLDQV